MRKFIMGLIVGIIIATTFNVVASSPNIKIYVDNIKIDSNEAFISEGVTMVPLRSIAEALGFSVKWEMETQTIHISSGKTEETEVRPKITIHEITNYFLPAVVTVDTGEIYGMGFFVSPDGKIITCAHVIGDCKNFIVTMQDGKKLNANLLKKEDKWDLALLKVSGSNFPYINKFNPDAKTLDPIYSFPYGLKYPVATGVVGAILEGSASGPHAKTIHYNGLISNGSSGGPVINEHGELIGVTFSAGKDSSQVAFAISAEYVQKILEQP